MHTNTIILTIFVVTYAGLAMGRIPGLKLNRVGIALLGAIAMMSFGHVTTKLAVDDINWPTVCLLFGFFVISAQLRLSGFYNLVAGGIAARLGHPARFLFILMAVTGGLSAFLNHDIVCFVFTPIVAWRCCANSLTPRRFSSRWPSPATSARGPRSSATPKTCSSARPRTWILAVISCGAPPRWPSPWRPLTALSGCFPKTICS